MEPATPALDAPKKIRIGRLEVGLNLFVQILIWLFIVGAVNYWSMRHFWRFDWGRNTNLQLSPQTKSLLGSLAKPTKAIVFFSGQAPEAEQDAVAMLREYEFAAKGKLTLEIVNPIENLTRARELAAQYKFDGSDSIVIFDYDGRSKFVKSPDMAVMERRSRQEEQEEMMRAMQGMPPSRPPPRMLQFKGEQVMTGALLEVIEPKQNKVYFLSGHGEIDYNAANDPQGRQLDQLKQNFARQNLQHAPLTLAEKDKVPDDANALVIIGPKLDFSERDLKLLADYWDRKGRFLICAGPTVGKKPNFDGWLTSLGVKPQNDDVLRVQNLGGFGVLQRGGILTGNSPILKDLANAVIECDAPVQSFVLDQAKAGAEQLRLTELMRGPKDFWGETTPLTGNAAPVFDKATDHPEPLTLAAQVEKGASTDVKLDSARLVIFGTSEMLTDRGIDVAPNALSVTLNAMNWLLSRENLISLPPKDKERRSYSFSPEQIAKIGWWVLAYMPGAVATFGLYYLWWRRAGNQFLLTFWVAVAAVILIGAWYALTWYLGVDVAPDAQTHRTFTRTISIVVAVVVAAVAFAGNVWARKKNQVPKSNPDRP